MEIDYINGFSSTFLPNMFELIIEIAYIVDICCIDNDTVYIVLMKYFNEKLK